MLCYVMWSGVQQTIVDDATDQWRKRLHCYVKANSRHFKHFCDIFTKANDLTVLDFIQYAVMLIRVLVLVLKDSLRTNFKSLSLSLSLSL